MRFMLILMTAAISLSARAETKIDDLRNSYGPDWIEGRSAAPKSEAPTKGKSTLLRKRVARTVSYLPGWLPTCFFFDPSADEKRANEAIRALAVAYATCGIALEPLTMTIKANYSEDPDALQAAALAVCPLGSIINAHGSVQVHTRHAAIPQKMCGDVGAKGCSTLCNTTSYSVLSFDAQPADVLHESMHANCCGPVCVDRGAGTGVVAGPNLEVASAFAPEKVWATSGAASASLFISAAGCAALRAGASSNDGTHPYDAARTAYYSAERVVDRQVDLMAKRSVLRPVATPMPVTLPPLVEGGSKTPTGPVGTPAPKRPLASKPGSFGGAEEEGAQNPGEKKRRAGRRQRGGALRKAGSITRKSNEADFEVDDLYGGGGGGGEGGGGDDGE